MCPDFVYESGFDFCNRLNMVCSCGGDENRCDREEVEYREGKDILRSEQEENENLPPLQ